METPRYEYIPLAADRPSELAEKMNAYDAAGWRPISEPRFYGSAWIVWFSREVTDA